jgi:hypothetical protein
MHVSNTMHCMLFWPITRLFEIDTTREGIMINLATGHSPDLACRVIRPLTCAAGLVLGKQYRGSYRTYDAFSTSAEGQARHMIAVLCALG